MLLEQPKVAPDELRRRTGWEIKPEGACKGDLCVPLPEAGHGSLDAQMLSDRLGMALVHDEEHGLWALGPDSGAGHRTLLSAELPPITLPDRHGKDFSLRSLRGTKVFMLAWASW
jgi:hypothetical protein